jgi:four helix bundle protein
MLIKRFEDLIAWQEARKLRHMIYRLSSKTEFSRDIEMRSQIRSAAVSAMTNIAEGFDNESKPEFARFLSIASRSTSEVQSLLYSALDEHYIAEAEFEENYEQARKAHALISGLRASIRKQIKALKQKSQSKSSTTNPSS